MAAQINKLFPGLGCRHSSSSTSVTEISSSGSFPTKKGQFSYSYALKRHWHELIGGHICGDRGVFSPPTPRPGSPRQ